jgi:hypothetical protein
MTKRVTDTVSRLQSILHHASGLIPGRTSTFQIDPYGALVNILLGAHEVAQMNAAWVALRTRMQLGIKNFEKYSNQFQHGTIPASPTSTVPELYTTLSEIRNPTDQLKFFYKNIPHHQVQLNNQARKNLKNVCNWDTIVPTPPLLATAFSGVWIPEANPSVMYYNTVDRAQYEQGGEHAPSSKGKGAAFSFPDKAFGMNTPFKAQDQFFGGFKGEKDMGPPNIRMEDPNVLHRIATPQPPNVESEFFCSQGFSAEQPNPAPRNSIPKDNGQGRGRQDIPGAGTGAKGIPDTSRPPTAGPGHSRGNPPTGFPGKHTDRSGGSYGGPPGGLGGSHSGGPPGGSGGGHSGGPPSGPDGGNEGSPGGFRRGYGGGDPPDGNGDPGGVGQADDGPPARREPLPAYGTMIPTIKAELKVEQLPSWDRNHETAIEYFWKIQQLASLGGHIPQALGYWLWSKLTEESSVQRWFATLTFQEQARMRSHYILYLKGIKDLFLGKTWQMKMNDIYESQSFRQAGHERESPADFINRRIMYIRMLVNSDNRGPKEVYLVMQKAPTAWGPIVVQDSIRDTAALYAKVTEHKKALVLSARLQNTNVITSENLEASLRRLGYNQAAGPWNTSFQRHANTMEAILSGEHEVPQVSNAGNEDANHQSSNQYAYSNEIAPQSVDKGVLWEAYQVLQRRQRPLPEGGYPFAKNDHVTTKMGRLLPSPCKVCGSKNHWDKECSDWTTYLERQRKHAKLVTTSEEDQAEGMYQSAFSVMMNQRIIDLDSQRRV